MVGVVVIMERQSDLFKVVEAGNDILNTDATEDAKLSCRHSGLQANDR